MAKLRWLLITVFVLLLLIAVDVSPLIAQDANDPEANKAILTHWWTVEAQHDYTRLSEFFTSDIVRHSTATSAVMPETSVSNLDEYRKFLEGTAALFPDYRMTPHLLSAEGDKVAFYAIFSGTFAQNGNRIEVPMVGFARLESGKIAELWVEWDNLTWNTQMMATPVAAFEAPVKHGDDMIGVWSIQIQGVSFRMEYRPDGTGTIVNLKGTGGALKDEGCPACEERFTYEVGDGQVHFLTSQLHPEFGDARYEAFVTKQDGMPVSLRFEAIGVDPMFERNTALDEQTVLLAETQQ